MSGAPTVSIAIRAFRRRWLGEAIASVLGQTYRDLELVVYDDAGDLDDVVAAFADARIRYHRAAERLEAAGRYRAAVALCRGRYVGLLDDDDRYRPEFVARLAGALDADPGAAAAVGRVVWDDAGTLREASDGRAPGPQADAAHAFAGSRWGVTPSTALVRVAVLEDGERLHPMPDDVAPDLFANVRAAAAGWRFVLVDEPLVVRRWHDGQVSRAGRAALDRSVATWQQLPVGDDADLDALRMRQLAHSLARRASFRLLEGDAPGARADLRAERAADPSTWRRRRLALQVAVLTPPAGRLAIRVWSALPHVRRRRRSPPA